MVDGAPHVGQVGFIPRLNSGKQTVAASNHQEPAPTFDAPLAPEANEITPREVEATHSLTDLQIFCGQNTREEAVKPIICGVNYTQLGTTSFG